MQGFSPVQCPLTQKGTAISRPFSVWTLVSRTKTFFFLGIDVFLMDGMKMNGLDKMGEILVSNIGYNMASRQGGK